ncbi:MAG: RsmE family RNA methyltransferase, partial [Chitinophagaceae bacterium]
MSGALPYFFIDSIAPVSQSQVLPEETSKHVVQVLRMKVQESLRLADGKGKLATAVITDDHKKKCMVSIVEIEENELPETRHTIAISLLKNSTRFEWFLEKAAELGIGRIVPLLCARTE